VKSVLEDLEKLGVSDAEYADFFLTEHAERTFGYRPETREGLIGVTILCAACNHLSRGALTGTLMELIILLYMAYDVLPRRLDGRRRSAVTLSEASARPN